MNDVVRTIARAMVDSIGKTWAGQQKTAFEGLQLWQIEIAVKNAQDVLTALYDAGYVVVPKEPTEAMMEAGNTLDCLGYAAGVWGEMLAAAPKVTD